MPRTPRIQYPGAIYHVMARGNRRENIVLGDDDRWMFLHTLCVKKGLTYSKESSRHDASI